MADEGTALLAVASFDSNIAAIVVNGPWTVVANEIPLRFYANPKWLILPRENE